MTIPPDTNHHIGTSDATPGGYAAARRPGERAFAVFMTLGSLALVAEAYGISGFEGLSAPGTVPLVVTSVMALTAVITLAQTWSLPRIAEETIARDILPLNVILFAVMLVGYALLLRPLGFLPTSALFLILAIKLLGRYSWPYSIAVGLGSLIGIWLIFRVVFTVLMPAGIFPEAELMQLFRDLSGGAR